MILLVSVPLRGLGQRKVDRFKAISLVLKVSVPLRGLGQRKDVAEVNLSKVKIVSVPLRGLGQRKVSGFIAPKKIRCFSPLAGIRSAERTAFGKAYYRLKMFQSPCGD